MRSLLLLVAVPLALTCFACAAETEESPTSEAVPSIDTKVDVPRGDGVENAEQLRPQWWSRVSPPGGPVPIPYPNVR